ncbi:MAG: hypothetical protein H8D58_01470 [Candidatus Marinimicrobia bacterium]|nr:hypothetical protein [Candidatus Neomarinimicrobiota bacterium]
MKCDIKKISDDNSPYHIFLIEEKHLFHVYFAVVTNNLIATVFHWMDPIRHGKMLKGDL